MSKEQVEMDLWNAAFTASKMGMTAREFIERASSAWKRVERSKP